MSELITFSESLNQALDQILEADPKVILVGLGVGDPKGIFGTSSGLYTKYGRERVIEIPISESAVTGVVLGAATHGLRPILVHQRLDFSLVSMDALVNQAAKWFHMFNGVSVPLVVRMIVGRGWGQGPQHSQMLHSWFSHIPGLKVVAPSNPFEAKGILTGAVYDDNPVIFMEHRWLHHIKDKVPAQLYSVTLDRARVVRAGKSISLMGISYCVIELIKAAELLESIGIDAEVVDLRSTRPLDRATIIKSATKTGATILIDHSDVHFGLGAEVGAILAETGYRGTYVRLGTKPYPQPTSHFQSADYYPSVPEVIEATGRLMQSPDCRELSTRYIRDRDGVELDKPDPDFRGPF